MAWRMGATWALIGFAAQCLIGAIQSDPLTTALWRALIHYVCWGAIGFVAGTALQRSVDAHYDRLETQSREQQEAQHSTEDQSRGTDSSKAPGEKGA